MRHNAAVVKTPAEAEGVALRIQQAEQNGRGLLHKIWAGVVVVLKVTITPGLSEPD
jgi:hypothetical protein